MRTPLSEQEKERIREMLLDGMTIRDVATATHHATSTIATIRSELEELPKRPTKESESWIREKQMLLDQYWPPKMPVKKKKRGKKRTLITPYHYPAMTKTKGESK